MSRTISYKCDRCGKPLLSTGATKLNITLQRGTDSVEKKSNDFCSTCFLKMKRAWKAALVMENPPTVEEPPKTKPVVIDDLEPTQEPIMDPKGYTKIPQYPELLQDRSSQITEPVTEESVPKKRGRKPKPVDPEEWLNRTEMAHGVIKPPEKAFILKLHVEEGLSVDEISEKLHRLPKGIKRAINAATKSGELDKLRAKFEGTETYAVAQETEEDSESDISEQETEDSETDESGYRVRRSSYIMPANTEVINGKKYDVGSILALHKAGWPASEIADEKGYDEDMVRLILDKSRA